MGRITTRVACAGPIPVPVIRVMALRAYWLRFIDSQPAVLHFGVETARLFDCLDGVHDPILHRRIQPRVHGQAEHALGDGVADG